MYKTKRWWYPPLQLRLFRGAILCRHPLRALIEGDKFVLKYTKREISEGRGKGSFDDTADRMLGVAVPNNGEVPVAIS